MELTDKQYAKIIRQVKLDRAARRKVELETRPAKVHAAIWATHRKDRTTRKQIPNTVRGAVAW